MTKVVVQGARVSSELFDVGECKNLPIRLNFIII